MIEIKDISERIKLSTEIKEGSIRRFELMKEDYVQPKFSLADPVYFGIGDSVEIEGEPFYITELMYLSFNETTGGYDYDLRFDSHYFRWKNHILFYDRQGNKEASWSLTRSPEAHLGIVVSNICALGFKYKGLDYQAVVDSTVDTSAKLVQYENTNIIDALTKIAETWECEWWVEGNKIYLGRCEHGEPINLEIGKELVSMTRSQSKETYANRVYAFGSTRNIPASYRPNTSDGSVVEGVVTKRLMLPEGIDHVDVVEGLKDSEVVDLVVVFDKVYPRTTCSITSVESREVSGDTEKGEPETYTIYRFKDSNFHFSEKYILPNEELRIEFQSGPLSSFDFAVKFNPDKASEDTEAGQVFEIVRNQDHGQWLPADPLKPTVGSQFVLYGFDTKFISDQLVGNAEQELFEETQQFVKKLNIDPSTYNCVVSSYLASGYDERNGILNPSLALNLKAGQKVNLINRAYFKDGRVSRVIGFEKKLDVPYDSPTYIVGESSAYSRIGELEEKIDNIQFKGNTYVNQGSGGGSIYVIKKDDPTAASDENVFSALRTLQEINQIRFSVDEMYLRKDINDTAHGIISFDQKIGSTLFLDGYDGKGWMIQNNGAAWLEAAKVRSDLFIGNRLGSPTFASGFPNGWGWDLSPYKRFNAANTEETKWRLELDDLIVRGKLRVFEMAISQLLGENDNRIFAGMMKVAFYDPATGRIYLDTDKGVLYNPFRPGDSLMVQRFGGLPSAGNNYNVIKQYELNVTDVGIGSITDGEDRLDWITFSNFVGELSDIADGDVLTRMDSVSDSTRKGIVKVTTIDEIGAPYIDVLYGIKTNPEESLKVRMGNLTGVRTKNNVDLTGIWGLYAQGAVLENSKIYLDNGMTVEQNFSVMNGELRSEIEALKSDMSLEQGNILRNSAFSINTHYWTAANTIHFIDVNGAYLWMNASFYVEKTKVADIYRDGSKNVLRLKNTYITQPNAIMQGEKKVGTYSFAFYVRCLRAGKLLAGIPGTDLYLEQTLSPSDAYQQISKSAEWNGQGDFSLQVQDGEMLIYGVSLFEDALANAVIRLQTQITQNEEEIKLKASKEYVDSETGKIYQKYQSDLSITADQIQANVRQEINGVTTSLSQLTAKYNEISASVSENEQDITNVRNLANSAASQATKALTTGIYGQEQYSQTSNPWNSWRSGEEYKHVGALWYNPSTGVTQRYTGTDGSNSWETVSNSAITAASYVLQNKDKWSLVVANFDAQGKPTSASGIVTTAYGNTLWASKNGIISAINQSAEAISINASKINLEGAVTANDYFKINTDGSMAAIGGTIGGFTIKQYSLESGGLTLTGGQIQFKKNRGVEVIIGGLSVSTGTQMAAIFTNDNNSGGTSGNGTVLSLRAGRSAYTNAPQCWIDCDHSGGWGSKFRVESRYFNDANQMERTAINVGHLMSHVQLKALSSNAALYPVYYDNNSGFLCYMY